MKKEDIIRHFKWHKKRSDSLQHGFMRFSPMEDCSQKFQHAACIHNGKHTHYHCLQVRYSTLIRQYLQLHNRVTVVIMLPDNSQKALCFTTVCLTV